MRTLRLIVAVALAALYVAGCGKSGSSSGTSTASSGSGSASASTSGLDAGPRAAEQPTDDSKVATGERLFKEKGCSACHAFGTKLSCPDLNGVTQRRTAAWMEHQILQPEVMTKEDPIAHALLAQYSLQMPNQKLTPDEAKSVIEYLKHQNHETLEAGKGE